MSKVTKSFEKFLKHYAIYIRTSFSYYLYWKIEFLVGSITFESWPTNKIELLKIYLTVDAFRIFISIFDDFSLWPENTIKNIQKLRKNKVDTILH